MGCRLAAVMHEQTVLESEAFGLLRFADLNEHVGDPCDKAMTSNTFVAEDRLLRSCCHSLEDPPRDPVRLLTNNLERASKHHREKAVLRVLEHLLRAAISTDSLRLRRFGDSLSSAREHHGRAVGELRCLL